MQQPESYDFLPKILAIAKALSSEHDRWKLYELILLEAQLCCDADGGTLYLTTDSEEGLMLSPVIMRNTSLDISITNHKNNALPDFPLYDPISLKPNNHHIATHCVLSKKTINIKNAHTNTDYDINGIKIFDKENHYHTHSILTVPLKNHDEHVIGVLQLINAHHESSQKCSQKKPEKSIFHKSDSNIIEALSSLVAISIENNTMLDQQHNLLIRLASQKESARLFEVILDEAQNICQAEGGTLYLLTKKDSGPALEFTILKNNKLNLHLGGTSETPIHFDPLPLYISDGSSNDIPNHKNIASFTAITKQLVNIQNAYDNPTFDFSGTHAFDQKSNYHSHSFLSVPLINHANDVIGVLQLVNAIDPITHEPCVFDAHLEPIIKALSTYAAIALENQILLQDHKNLLDAFVQCIAKAIDAKSPHTSAHCQRVPVITELLAQAACHDTQYFPSFSLDADGWYELKVASWLHDCGKLSTPDSILDKATKLHSLRDGIESINAHFELIKQQEYCTYLEHCIAYGKDTNTERIYQNKITQLNEDQTFVNQANIGAEFFSEQDKERVQRIASLTWKDSSGKQHSLLSPIDASNLCISRGTLNTDERNKINDHMRVTIEMLNSLPFPKHLKKVPEYAGGHHEKMDGTGFPKQLTREQMSIPARIMAIADIFEALTSQDRPYKSPMKISQALSILQGMRDKQHIDHELYQVFLKERVWEQYAQQHLHQDQLDIIDPTPYR